MQIIADPQVVTLLTDILSVQQASVEAISFGLGVVAVLILAIVWKG